MNRIICAVSVLAATLAIAPAGFAKDIKETRAFTKADGTKIVSHTNFHTKTDVTTEKVVATRKDGEKKTVAERVSPDLKGGFTVSKTVTSFSGQTHTSTSTVGAGHGSHGAHGKASQAAIRPTGHTLGSCRSGTAAPTFAGPVLAPI